MGSKELPKEVANFKISAKAFIYEKWHERDIQEILLYTCPLVGYVTDFKSSKQLNPIMSAPWTDLIKVSIIETQLPWKREYSITNKLHLK